MNTYTGFGEFAFISYSHKNADRVRAILEKFRSMGLRFWMDESLNPSDEYIEVIAQKVEECAFFITFVSKDSISSKYCKDEIRFAYENNKPIMTIYLEPCELSAGMKLMLNGEQYIEAYIGNEKEACNEALKAFPNNIVNELGEQIYETKEYVYYLSHMKTGNGYNVCKMEKDNGKRTVVLREVIPPAADYSVNYVSRAVPNATQFSICINVIWDFTYSRIREDEYFEECYLYTFSKINDDTTLVDKSTIWREDKNTGEVTKYDYVSGVNTSTKNGKIKISGKDTFGNKWNIADE